MMLIVNGVEVQIKTGFTVHNPDGTAEQIVYAKPVFPDRPDDDGPGERQTA